MAKKCVNPVGLRPVAARHRKSGALRSKNTECDRAMDVSEGLTMNLSQCPFALVTADRSLTPNDAAILIESNKLHLVEELRSIAPTAALSTMLISCASVVG